MGWEQSELMADAPGRRTDPPAAPAGTKTPALPEFVSPVTLMVPALSKLGDAAVKSGKSTFVRLPCFIC
jgi:hypothetical protein